MNDSYEHKIVSPEQLAERLHSVRAASKTVVQCHGCFDLVHPGHVRYLQFARQLGDVLVVSLTGDATISKGPDRPYIPQELRAENLAALQIVDWVVIDDHPTAEALLGLLRPDVYVKGSEYASTNDPRFLREREIVERAGGRVVFHSGDVVFSSTKLIRALQRDEALDECRLRTLCQRHGIDRRSVHQVLAGFEGRRVVVAGDVVRERYVLCDAGQAAPDAPVLALQQLGETYTWGGAAALALQTAALGARVTLVTAAPAGEEFAELRDAGVEVRVASRRPELVTQSAFVADDAKLMQLQTGGRHPLDSAAEREAWDAIRDAIREATALVWCDGGFGFVAPTLTWKLIEPARGAGVCIAGCAPGTRADLTALRETDFVFATERQLRETLHDMAAGLPAVTWRFLNETDGRTAIVSLHKRGVIGFDGRSDAARGTLQRLRSDFVPALAPHFTDLLGRNEAITAVATLALATGARFPLATYLAAAAEATTVTRLARTTVQRHELFAWTDARPELMPSTRFVAQPGPISAPTGGVGNETAAASAGMGGVGRRE